MHFTLLKILIIVTVKLSGYYENVVFLNDLIEILPIMGPIYSSSTVQG